jgi:mRNA interferase RelE/StbE
MTTPFRVEWKTSAIRELRRLGRQDLSRLLSAVEALASAPYPVGVRKLQGGQHTYRIRVGDYRVIYEVYEKRLIIYIVRVRHRKDVYRG